MSKKEITGLALILIALVALIMFHLIIFVSIAAVALCILFIVISTKDRIDALVAQGTQANTINLMEVAREPIAMGLVIIMGLPITWFASIMLPTSLWEKFWSDGSPTQYWYGTIVAWYLCGFLFYLIVPQVNLIWAVRVYAWSAILIMTAAGLGWIKEPSTPPNPQTSGDGGAKNDTAYSLIQTPKDTSEYVYQRTVPYQTVYCLNTPNKGNWEMESCAGQKCNGGDEECQRAMVYRAANGWLKFHTKKQGESQTIPIMIITRPSEAFAQK